MIKIFKSLLKYTNPNNAFLFIGIALVFQLFYLYIFNSFEVDHNSVLYFQKGDGIQYINYCENLFKYGTYFEGTIAMPLSYVNRMPGMYIIYFPLRLLFKQEHTLTYFVIIQALFASISAYILALTSKRIFKNNIAFYFTFLIFTTSTYCANYLHILYTESLALSTIIFAFYFFIEYNYHRKLILLLSFYCFLIWSVFLRPYIAPFILISSLYFLYLGFRNQLLIRHLIICFSVVLIIFGLWTYRNYYHTKQFIPLQQEPNWYKSDPSTNSRIRFIKSFGLGWVWWVKKSEHTWFFKNEELKKDYNICSPNDSILTGQLFCEIFSKQLPIDSLKKARSDYWESLDTSYTKYRRDSLSKKSSQMFEKYITFQKEKHPIDYYLTSRLKILFKLLNQAHGASINSFKYPLNIIFTFFDAIVNYFVFVFGSFSLFLLLFRKRYYTFEFLSFMLFPLFILCYFSSVVRIDESRFVTLVFPFLIFASFEGLRIVYKFKHSKIFFTCISIFLIYGGIFSVIHDINW